MAVEIGGCANVDGSRKTCFIDFPVSRVRDVVIATLKDRRRRSEQGESTTNSEAVNSDTLVADLLRALLRRTKGPLRIHLGFKSRMASVVLVPGGDPDAGLPKLFASCKSVLRAQHDLQADDLRRVQEFLSKSSVSCSLRLFNEAFGVECEDDLTRCSCDHCH